jgi:hypothetical protein
MAQHVKNAVLEIMKAIFGVLQDGHSHTLTDLSYSTRHTPKSIKKCLAVIALAQQHPSIIQEGTRYQLKPEKQPEAE